MKAKLIDILNLKLFLGKNSKMTIQIFVMLIAISIIGITLSNQSDFKAFKIKQLNDEINVLQSDYIVLKQEVQKSRLSSQLEKDLESLGLKPIHKPVEKIVVVK
ncbi:MAG: hypothetical protein CMC19_06335 [Flavobacteriaceae bacterium]|nr:hypothetical protein [Flavobacteriaceae bacterium]OUX39738.1 MAG: hypothetical protein CBE25_02855 [Flavobacteriaceae bacterium TMED265]